MGKHFKGIDSNGDEILEPILSPQLLLNKSSYTDFLKDEKGMMRYFVSGATANSFAYESLYLGNPGAYQTFIIGTNDICSSAEDIYKYLDVASVATSEQIENFRKNAHVNTYGETAPLMGDEIVDLLNSQQSETGPYITFGVDRVLVRTFEN